MILLDTHALYWADGNDRKLGKKARAALQRAWQKGRVAVSAITFWEIGALAAKKRLRLPMPTAEWRTEVLEAGVIELPLDGAIALRSLDLANLHDDPADRFIAATALVHGATLMTADQRLLDWKHPLERIDARG